MRNEAIGHYCPALTYWHGHHGQAGAYKDSRKAKSTYLGRCIERRGMMFGSYTLLLVREDHTYAMKVLEGVRLSPYAVNVPVQDVWNMWWETVPCRCMLRQGIHYALHPVDQPGSTILQRSRAVDSM